MGLLHYNLCQELLKLLHVQLFYLEYYRQFLHLELLHADQDHQLYSKIRNLREMMLLEKTRFKKTNLEKEKQKRIKEENQKKRLL